MRGKAEIRNINEIKDEAGGYVGGTNDMDIGPSVPSTEGARSGAPARRIIQFGAKGRVGGATEEEERKRKAEEETQQRKEAKA